MYRLQMGCFVHRIMPLSKRKIKRYGVSTKHLLFIKSIPLKSLNLVAIAIIKEILFYVHTFSAAVSWCKMTFVILCSSLMNVFSKNALIIDFASIENIFDNLHLFQLHDESFVYLLLSVFAFISIAWRIICLSTVVGHGWLTCLSTSYWTFSLHLKAIFLQSDLHHELTRPQEFWERGW